MEKIVLTQEELTELDQLSQQRQNLTNDFGVIEFRIQDLELQKEQVIESLSKLKQQEIQFGSKIQEKYGEGSININTGEFTKAN
jgi:tRNA/tmRNA/rRNA uracil-C5-methylase (TrmA/RlmC/RlmD family)